MKPDTLATNAPKVVPNLTRNLTYEGIREHVNGMKAVAVRATPQFEVAKVYLPKKDAKGNVVKDVDGFVELVEKTVLKRDLVAAEWDERLAGLE